MKTRRTGRPVVVAVTSTRSLSGATVSVRVATSMLTVVPLTVAAAAF
jgi:hypothetical protein